MPKSAKKLVVLGMSGGVDSSVSLMLLKKAGYEVVGVSLKYDIWRSANRAENICCSKDSFDIAKRVCEHFDTKHVVIDVSKAFKEEVIDYFTEELRNNRTPSPCVFCNPKIKFKALLDYADKIGARYVATGHYARVKKRGDLFNLVRAKNVEKDQTYSLSFLTQGELSRTIFPLGKLSKNEVYALARENEILKVFEKIKQSQDFCFLGRNQLNEFIAKEINPKAGNIVESSGSVIGQHKGLPYYTIGQRKGIELPGGPYYVIAKKVSTNELIVSKNPSDYLAYKIILKPFNLINETSLPMTVKTKLRSSQGLFEAILNKEENNQIGLTFKRPQSAVTAGQVAVFYKANVCLGSGVIDQIVYSEVNT